MKNWVIVGVKFHCLHTLTDGNHSIQIKGENDKEFSSVAIPVNLHIITWPKATHDYTHKETVTNRA